MKFHVSIGEYELCCQPDYVPDTVAEFQSRARLSEAFETTESNAGSCYTSVARDGDWPFLVVVQRYYPAGYGFEPGALLVPDSGRLFLGAGRRLLGYDLAQPSRLFEDETDCGFWGWSQHGQVVLMAGELELAAWDFNGRKLWSQFVEPPWQYRVEGEIIRLDVMGKTSNVGLVSGRIM